MPYRVVTCVLVVLCWGGTPANAQFRAPSPIVPGENFSLELGLMFWQPTPELRIQTGALSVDGDNQVDFVQELGIENRRFREIRAVLRAGRQHKLRLNYLPITYEQEATLQRTIVFGDRTFSATLPVTSQIEWTQWRFGYQWDFASGDRAQLGLLTELRRHRMSAELSAPAVGREIAETQLTMATIGIVGRAYVHRNVSVTAEFAGFRLPGVIGRWLTDDDLEARFRDFDIYATASLSRHFGVQGGYRSQTADYFADDTRADLVMKGMYFGAMIRF